ncbi:hypothetical protein A9Q75_18615 [Colwellia psychrerythraea]|uniref:Big-1 domain-containing protein n=1 Tax=Colwellia psychrerythraea TaxID=28229 RepID=A0A1Y5DYH0_COLPS|nr:hypothetical protein A9Q75_18615 [Colwellia psychrerythraea]
MGLLRRISFTMLLMSMMTLVACGGGDGDLTGGGDGGTSPNPDVVTLSLAKSDGDLSGDKDIIISATVMQGSTLLSGKLVTFALTDNTKENATLSSTSQSTGSNGVATITVSATNAVDGVEIIATVTGVDPMTISFNSLGGGVKIVEGEPKAASIRLFASSQQLASSGAQSIELSAIAKDENNNLLEGVTINFASDSGALGKILDESGGSSNLTGRDGKVAMELSTQDEPSNRVILVTVTSGDITDSLEVEVVGTTVTLTGSSSLAINDENNYIVKVLDSDGNGVAKTAVTLSLGGGGAGIELPSPAMVTTDSEGQATVKVTGTTGGINSIVVTALGATASQDVSVQADSFLFTSFSNGIDTVNPSNSPIVPDVSLEQTASITLTWMRDNAFVPDGKSVSFTTTRGIVNANSATTVDGEVTVALTSTDAGKALVTFVGTDVIDGKDVELTNQLEFEFFADTAATIKAQASPNSIGPNEQTSSISVVVKDANGNLVKNKRVKFVLEDVSGGSIFPATAVTDSSGSASTIYTSNSTSAKDAVSIEAIVEDTPAITDTVNITVSNRELFISLGTGNELEELDTTDYVKEYSVFVTDAESNAVENVELTVSAIPENYYKGLWVPTYDGNDFVLWLALGEGSTNFPGPVYLGKTTCVNEDANFDGILDAGEDFNGDGKLTPGNIVSISGTLVTDTDGRSVIRVIYPQSYGHWLDVKLIVSGKVTGSESSTQAIFTLPVSIDDINEEDITPPTQGIGTRGPFGLSNECSNNISQDPPL